MTDWNRSDWNPVNWSERTPSHLAERSDWGVFGLTSFFALPGAVMMIFTGGAGAWGLWIPLCFLVIPPVHYLCREVLRLRRRLASLERRLFELESAPPSR